MERITSHQVVDLMEAYNQVHTPQITITEEQIQEDFENWVNSLVEEGHDLSEYTWEDMYESYLDEMGQPGGNVPGGNRPISNAPYQSRFARPMNAGTPQRTGRGTVVSRPQIGSLPANYRSTALSAPAAGQRVAGRVSNIPTASRPATPAPTASRPATPAPTASRPATPAPTASRPATPAPTAAKPAVPAPASTPKPANPLMSNMPTVPSTAAPAGGVQLSARAQALKAGGPQGNARARVLNQDLDIFDIIKGHLLDEGYADTEEAALQIMANMSEEWKKSIIG